MYHLCSLQLSGLWSGLWGSVFLPISGKFPNKKTTLWRKELMQPELPSFSAFSLCSPGYVPPLPYPEGQGASHAFLCAHSSGIIQNNSINISSQLIKCCFLPVCLCDVFVCRAASPCCHWNVSREFLLKKNTTSCSAHHLPETHTKHFLSPSANRKSFLLPVVMFSYSDELT